MSARAEVDQDAPVRRLLLAPLLLAGCYGHLQVPPAPATRPPLPPARSVVYQVTRGGEVLGIEAVTVTASAAWALSGVMRRGGQVPARSTYWLVVDPERAEPTRLSASVELLGERRTLTASVADGWVHVHVGGLGPAVDRKVPYAPGTSFDLLSPLVRSWWLALLSDRLTPGQDIPLRTVRFEAPAFAPQVELQSVRLHRVQDGLRLVEVSGPDGRRREALWLDGDGFVVRARAWLGGPKAPFFEWRVRVPSSP